MHPSKTPQSVHPGVNYFTSEMPALRSEMPVIVDTLVDKDLIAIKARYIAVSGIPAKALKLERGVSTSSFLATVDLKKVSRVAFVGVTTFARHMGQDIVFDHFYTYQLENVEDFTANCNI